MPTDTPAPKLHTVKTAAAILGLTNFAVYNLMDAGDLESRYIGARRMVPVASLDAFIAGLPSQRPAGDVA